MLVRTLAPELCTEIQPAYKAFLRAQDVQKPPYGVLHQSEHSRLAGGLAGALLPDVFGPLNAHVLAAIADHDYGWNDSDDRQMSKLKENIPYPFTKVSPEETLPCWVGSIAHGRQLGGLAGVLISRHCCLLGTGSPKHAQFVEEETKQREQIEATLPYTPRELDGWTAALGFCDLLSLYLCSGSRTPVKLPLSHPEGNVGSRSVSLRWIDGQPYLSQPIFQPNTSLYARATKYSGNSDDNEPLTAAWVLGQQVRN